jgi:membrane associated rhomboid family serine protease
MSYNNEYRPGGFFRLPVVTKNIIIISVILFAATEILMGAHVANLYDYLGLHYYLAPSFKPHQFVTYIFMHGSFMHIFFNMFGVYMFGQVLEELWGPKRYLIFFIVTGLGAALAQYLIMHFEISGKIDLMNHAISATKNAGEKAYLIEEKYYQLAQLDQNVIIGASGSLFGLLGAFGMLFPNQMLYVYFLIPIKAKWMVMIYGGLELVMGLNSNPEDNVAHFAHIGGLIVGVILVLIWRKRSPYS